MKRILFVISAAISACTTPSALVPQSDQYNLAETSSSKDKRSSLAKRNPQSNETLKRAAEEVQNYMSKEQNYIHPLAVSQKLNNRFEFSYSVPSYGSSETKLLLIDKTGGQREYSVAVSPFAYETALATDPSRNLIASGTGLYGKLQIIDVITDKLIECPVGPTEAASQHLVRIQSSFYMISEGNSANGQAPIALTKFDYIGETCTKTIIPVSDKVTTMYYESLRVVAEQQSIVLYQNKNNLISFSEGDYLERIVLNTQGVVISRQSFAKYKLRDAGPHSFQRPSYREKIGTLVPLIQVNDLSESPGLYLIYDNGRITQISEEGLYGSWIENGDILLHRGRHSSSSQVVILKAPDYKTEVQISQPVGFKTNISYADQKINFVNEYAFFGAGLFQSRLNYVKFKELLAYKNPNFKYANIPVSQEVVYSSPAGPIPSLLFTKDKCTADRKNPAIVYVHGGQFSGSYDFFGHRFSSGNLTYSPDEMLLIQAGFVVIGANYVGDRYFGNNFKTKSGIYAARDAYDRHLRDIHAAGLYAKSLPCVDPNKVILFGQSFGAEIGAIYLTSKEYRQINPFSAAVLRGGSYTYDNWNLNQNKAAFSPRIAMQDTELNKTYFRIGEKDVAPTCVIDPYVYVPKTNLKSLDEALKQLSSLRKAGKNYYGVLYSHTNSFYNRIIASRRASDIHDIPITLIQGTDDEVSGPIAFEAELKKYSSKIQSLYVENAGHYFLDNNQVQMIDWLADNFTN